MHQARRRGGLERRAVHRQRAVTHPGNERLEDGGRVRGRLPVLPAANLLDADTPARRPPRCRGRSRRSPAGRRLHRIRRRRDSPWSIRSPSARRASSVAGGTTVSPSASSTHRRVAPRVRQWAVALEEPLRTQPSNSYQRVCESAKPLTSLSARRTRAARRPGARRCRRRARKPPRR